MMFDYSQGTEEEKVAAQWEFVMRNPEMLGNHDMSLNADRPEGVPDQVVPE